MFNKIQKLLFSLIFIIGGGMITYGTVGAITYIMVPQGGTGAGTYASQTVLIGSSTNPIATTTWTIPQADGTVNQILKTDGSGALTWQADSDSGGGGGAFATSTADYWLTTKDTADLTEGTDLYFTNGRVADYINASTTMAVGNWNLTVARVNQSVLINSSPTFVTPTISGFVWDGVTLATSSDILNLWDLNNLGNVDTSGLASGDTFHYNGSNWVSTSTIFVNASTGCVGIGTSSPCCKLCVDGSIRTTDKFYGDYWLSYSGNSMAIQPTGDVDDYFSFKTPSHRPTIKREGGKFIYFDSSNVYDVGISLRDDDTYSGTLNYEKDDHMMTMLGKASPLGFKANSDYDDYIKIQTASNLPEITVASSTGLKINAGGTNSLLLNHSGGNVGIGTTSPSQKISVNGNGYITGTLAVDGNVTGNNLDISNWDTAHGWGDHSVAGYAIGSFDVLGQATSTLNSHTTTYNHANYNTAYGWGNHSVVGYNLQSYASSTYMWDSDINSFSELQSWISDGVLVKAGTLTDTKACVWDSAGSQIVCDTALGGSGTVTSVAMSVPTGLTIGGSPITTSGTLALTYTGGYAAVKTASTTNWNTFYDTPSNRITDGTNLAWSGNTLNATDTNTNANTVCSGGTTYMDGDGNCDDISSVYVNDGCSDCLNATEIEDIYLLDTTDTLTGQLTVDGTDSATSTIQGNIKFENNAGSHGCYFIYGATTTLECF